MKYNIGSFCIKFTNKLNIKSDRFCNKSRYKIIPSPTNCNTSFAVIWHIFFLFVGIKHWDNLLISILSSPLIFDNNNKTIQQFDKSLSKFLIFFGNDIPEIFNLLLLLISNNWWLHHLITNSSSVNDKISFRCFNSILFNKTEENTIFLSLCNCFNSLLQIDNFSPFSFNSICKSFISENIVLYLLFFKSVLLLFVFIKFFNVLISNCNISFLFNNNIDDLIVS